MQIAENDRSRARLDRRPDVRGRDREGVGRSRQKINEGPGGPNDLVQHAEPGRLNQDAVAGPDHSAQRLRHAVSGARRRQHLIGRDAVTPRDRLDQTRIAAAEDALEIALILGVEHHARGFRQQGHRLLYRALEQAERLVAQRHAPIQGPHPDSEIRDAVQRLARVKILAGRFRMKGREVHAD
ncbi:hypothetical protein D3C72_913050 [compost metagenome]